MARPEAPITETGALAQFARDLRQLRGQAGLTYRQLAARAGVSPSTASVAASGHDLPSWAVVRAYLTGCGADPAAWHTRWQQLYDHRAQHGHGDLAAVHGARPARPALQFRLLGPVGASRAGVEVTGLGRTGRALLAAFLLERTHTVSLPQLLRTVQDHRDERDDAPGPRAVSSGISRLRKALHAGAALGEPDVLTPSAAGYRLSIQDDQLDLARFTQHLARARQAHADGALDEAAYLYQQALAQWSGGPLDNLDQGQFASRRVALRERRHTAEVGSLAVQLDRGQYGDALAASRRLLGESPFDQDAVALLMRALYHSGRVQEALEVFRDTSQRLRRELGLDPLPRLARLHRAMLRNELEDERVVQSATSAPATQPAPR